MEILKCVYKGRKELVILHKWEVDPNRRGVVCLDSMTSQKPELGLVLPGR